MDSQQQKQQQQEQQCNLIYSLGQIEWTQLLKHHLHSFIPSVLHFSATVKVEQAKHTSHILSGHTQIRKLCCKNGSLDMCICKYDLCRWGFCASDTSDGNWIGHKMLFVFIVDEIIYSLCLSFSSITFRLFFSYSCLHTCKTGFHFLHSFTQIHCWSTKCSSLETNKIGIGERMSTIGSSKTCKKKKKQQKKSSQFTWTLQTYCTWQNRNEIMNIQLPLDET